MGYHEKQNENDLEIANSIGRIAQRNDKMESFLRNLYRCGSAYEPNMDEVKKFLDSADNHGNKETWIELRDIVSPDFDDSE